MQNPEDLELQLLELKQEVQQLRTWLLRQQEIADTVQQRITTLLDRVRELSALAALRNGDPPR